MKKLLTLLVVSACSISPVALLAQGQEPPPQGEGRPGGGQREESPVGREMEGIQSAYRKLNRQYSDAAQKAASLELVASMEKHLEAVKSLTPSKAGKLSGDPKKKYMETYRKDLDDLGTTIASLKDALNAGNNDAAKAALDKIGQLKNSSHKELGVGGGGRGGPRGGSGGRGSGGPAPGAPAASPQASPKQ